MAAPTLLFCIGAAKSGTSWLYEYLYRHPDCHLREVKELHYFDGLDTNNMAWERKDNARRTVNAALAIGDATGAWAKRLKDQVRDREDWLMVQEREAESPDAYLNYLTKGLGDERLIADFTPGYAALSTARFRMMAQVMPDVRFIFLMRDPFQRLWSHVRMNAARHQVDMPDRTERIFRRLLKDKEPSIAERSDYATTLARLGEAVAHDKCLIMTYEEMFAGGYLKICDFLGIARLDGDTSRVFHRGKPLAFPEAFHDEVVAWLRPQYAAVAAHFGKMPDGWDPMGQIGGQN